LNVWCVPCGKDAPIDSISTRVPRRDAGYMQTYGVTTVKAVTCVATSIEKAGMNAGACGSGSAVVT
jgi:hypothetical protein